MKKSKVSTIFLIIAIIALIAGITLIIVGAGKLNADYRFDTTHDEFMSGSICVAFGSICVFFGIGSLIGSLVSRGMKSVMSGDALKRLEENPFIQRVKQTMQDRKDEEVRAHTCAYCGSRLKDGETKCPNCGATKK